MFWTEPLLCLHFFKHLIWQYNISCKSVEEITELFHSFRHEIPCAVFLTDERAFICYLCCSFGWLLTQSHRAWMGLEVEKAEVAELPYNQKHWVMLCKVYDVDLCYISWNKVAGSYWRGIGPHLSPAKLNLACFLKQKGESASQWALCLWHSLALWVRAFNLDILLLSSLTRRVICYNALPSLLSGRPGSVLAAEHRALHVSMNIFCWAADCSGDCE